jgi:hypothetical protein
MRTVRLGLILAATALLLGCGPHQTFRFGDPGTLDSADPALTRATAFRLTRDGRWVDVAIRPFDPVVIPITPARVRVENSRLTVTVDSGLVDIVTAGIRPVVRTDNVIAGAHGTSFSLVRLPPFGDIVIVTEHEGAGTAVEVTTVDGSQRVELGVGPLAVYDQSTGSLRVLPREGVPDHPRDPLMAAARALIDHVSAARPGER